MFIDSIKYSLKGRWDFLLLRFVFWLLTFSLHLISQDILLGIFLMILWALLAFIEERYLVSVIEESIFGSEVCPKFKNIKKLIIRGIKEIFIFVIYAFIPLSILIVLIFDLMIFSFNFSVFLLFLLSAFFAVIMVEGAIIHYEYNHSKFKTAFEFRTIMRKLRSMSRSRFITSFFIVLLISLLVSPLISEFSESTNPLISTIVEFTILPFLAIFSSRFMGLIGRDIILKKIKVVELNSLNN
ncbi:hypothetical protein ALNOE001_11370 [Candidatus Methanobinarius endosymbioticus]|uniref:Glycerophosphoryl diester phosphodiesterase membrane domain-containing protein n=1 Tax=Candidatus Methanobinarius endosymbioticus TaxID=2006182 RepID=A0A366MA84_9EURY|nr:hypothetical protein ALNOE001_11370 [Candidatus Methanobinarius endosymbioticus]